MGEGDGGNYYYDTVMDICCFAHPAFILSSGNRNAGFPPETCPLLSLSIHTGWDQRLGDLARVTVTGSG